MNLSKKKATWIDTMVDINQWNSKNVEMWLTRCFLLMMVPLVAVSCGSRLAEDGSDPLACADGPTETCRVSAGQLPDVAFPEDLGGDLPYQEGSFCGRSQTSEGEPWTLCATTVGGKTLVQGHDPTGTLEVLPEVEAAQPFPLHTDGQELVVLAEVISSFEIRRDGELIGRVAGTFE